MTHVLTVIGPPGTSVLDEQAIEKARRSLAASGADVGAIRWLAPKEACDLFFASLDPGRATAVARRALSDRPLDLAAQAAKGRRKRVFLADMESTIIAEEMLDELARKVGVADSVEEVTRRAMAGELDFEESLRARVSLMAGQPAELLYELAETMTLNPGAETLLKTLRQAGVYSVLVSGGFTQFAERVRELCTFDEIRSNRLILADGRITGDLREPILDRDAKEKILREVCGRQGLSPSCAAAVGDGANDLAMVRAAGLGVSFRGKQILRDASPFCIDHGDLTALLYLQGYPREAFAP